MWCKDMYTRALNSLKYGKGSVMTQVWHEVLYFIFPSPKLISGGIEPTSVERISEYW